MTTNNTLMALDELHSKAQLYDGADDKMSKRSYDNYELLRAALTAKPDAGVDVVKVKEWLDQSILDLSYYIHLATKAKTNNKWIDCEVYKITMSLERLEKATAAIDHLYSSGRLSSKAECPDGWQLVPIEPTVAMQNAAIDAHGIKLGCIAPLGFKISPQQMFEQSYKAMLSAAPQPPIAGGEE